MYESWHLQVESKYRIENHRYNYNVAVKQVNRKEQQLEIVCIRVVFVLDPLSNEIGESIAEKQQEDDGASDPDCTVEISNRVNLIIRKSHYGIYRIQTVVEKLCGR
ncbi:unnamed protein product [Kuraishia capsulata CBS 1993]|uniref:Uncharacterized protein n=1 Tax=Kuraishia capsulata CBS 1993 TaxID=1382522 RepID=W6MLQ7_9ASCO|nr:uncharacterized protein KUCA_T00001767001 [Kuraishia capsulata CBS 1993]CDK25797.1 unnamed protein product [Kuraishia capsulata CBS 1993]